MELNFMFAETCTNGKNGKNGCSSCTNRGPGYFCDLSPDTLKEFEAIRFTKNYDKGGRLFSEGQPANGVYVLCGGRVKLTMHSSNGRALIVRVAAPGEVLGLSRIFSDSTFETTAEAVEPCHIHFVRKPEFRHFLQHNTEAGMKAIEQLSKQSDIAHSQIRALGLSTCVADKLAVLLLQWTESLNGHGGPVYLKNTFSHEEIAEMIGTSRETVTRLFKYFRERGLIKREGSDLCIPDRRRLEASIGNVRGR